MAPKQRPQRAARSGSNAAPVRLLNRREGSQSLLLSTQTMSSSASRRKSPTPPKALYRPKSRDDITCKTPPALPPAPPPVPEPPRHHIGDASVLLQRLNALEKLLKTGSDDQDELESACSGLRCTCVELIKAYPKTAKKLNINEKLWRSWYREIEGQSSVLKECTAFYSSLVDGLQSSLRRRGRLPEHLDGLKHSLQQSLIALGDVARYEQNQLEKERRDWNEARNYYQQALEVAPSNGKVYNQLGLLAVLEGKLLDGAYMYARSLTCDNPFGNAGNLLHVLKRGKNAAKQRQTQQETPGKSTCEAMETYATRVISCLYMAQTGEGSKTELDAALERMQSALVSLLDVCDQQDEATPIDGSLLEALSRTLIQTVCLLIVLIHYNVEKTSHQAFNNGTKRALAVSTMTASSLLSKLTAVLSASAESTRTKYFTNALLPALNIYLDWLQLHEARLSSKTLQKECVLLFHILSANGFIERGLYCAQKREGDLSNATLPEDRELNGFLLLEKALQARFPEELTPEKKFSRQLTEEERLVLRATRFMALSERFVFGKAPAPITFVPTGASHEPRDSKTGRNSSSKATKTTARVDPLAIDPVVTGRLCILCSNTSTFPDGECEFCGYEDDVDATSDNEKDPVQQPLWIQEYDLAYNNEFSPKKSTTSPRSSPARRIDSNSSTSSTLASSPQSDSPPSPPQTLEADFKTIMSIGAEHADFQDSLSADKTQRLIVIDAPNVAMRHGKGKVFSCAGIELAVNYFQALGHRVVAFIPDYMLQSDEERREREEQGEVLTASKIPDDVALLEHLMHKGVLIPTPPQDYDDSYSIQYAGLHNGYVVTNDLFRDHIVNMVGPRERKVAMRVWLRAHQISYSWVRNEFLPNPNFRFPETADGAF
ncbi:hypothetical protein F441_05606 [Phytophthora nicotianae CJ01A1]|uniref:Uncharacterized protein n=3 Tax=Phytophthora nicotianae TaxID=4792 RepID=V9FJM9_PHYNI|nr:hypothetical protein F443_05592 [Phytophthora nicotianae P1569]ETK90864.1 hypothetical protein L915_05457 [Phytophthora nicotianae]ETL44275.1 hypothetical protein L916_05403 [Phytophthora nicotianae]ETM50599.1 hypothetical protein L914_05409 [Phytophthora nicotianae]ETP20735.1 hypothetical protein F441_05606 [Phytophthora nicotianae CJ01A1]